MVNLYCRELIEVSLLIQISVHETVYPLCIQGTHNQLT